MDIVLSSTSLVPLYEQISEQIKRQIILGEMPKGSPLPSIRGLATSLKVSVITTKRAYEELEADGFVTTIAGKGSFVSEKNTDVLRDAVVCQLEKKLEEIIATAKTINLSCEDLCEIIKQLY